MSASNTFDDFVGLLDYPMFIVTANAHGKMGGCLVGFATQASISPQTFLVGLSHPNHTLDIARESTHLAVHLIARENIELARLFGSESNDTLNKFDYCSWHLGPAGLPILDTAEAWFGGAIMERFEMGDHVGHLLRPWTGHVSDNPRPPVSFHDVKDLTPGHPTQSEESDRTA